MTLSLIVAASENNVIGRKGDLPWHLPLDLKHFKELTIRRPVLMGRKTYESIVKRLGKPLPERTNIVITRDTSKAHDPQYAGAIVVGSLDEAISVAKKEAVEEACVIGGEEIFRMAFPLADRVHLTRVHAEVEGDVFLPAMKATEWEKIAEERHGADERHAYAFTFETYERKQ